MDKELGKIRKKFASGGNITGVFFKNEVFVRICPETPEAET